MTNYTKAHSSKLIELLIQANQLRQKREYRQALKIYHDVIEQFGETADTAQTLAHCYFQLGFYESDDASSIYQLAITWIKKAITLSPTNSRLHVDLGEFHSLGTLEYQEAAQEYKAAIELDPNNVRALVGGAALYGLPEEVVTLNEAIAWLERVVQLEPNDPNYHFRLGTLYHQANHLSGSESEWLKALLCPRPLDTSPAQTIIKLTGGTAV